MKSLFSRKKIPANQDDGGEVWQVLGDKGIVVAEIGPSPLAAETASQIEFALNATLIANAELMDRAASMIDSGITPGTDVARELRAAARVLSDGAPFSFCTNDGADCNWSGHVAAPDDAECVPCPICGELAEIVRS